MNHVERFNAVMNFEKVDRLPRIEWAAYWDKTLKRWREEGLDESHVLSADIREHMGLDPYRQFWLPTRMKGCPQPAHHGAGIIENEADYDSIKAHIFHDDEKLWSREYTDSLKAQVSKDCVSWLSLDGFFWFPRELLGVENHMYAFYDEPELIHRINQELVDYHLRCIEQFCNRVTVPQFMTFAEDMSYNNGPMMSKEVFDEFLAPYYRQVIPALKEKGIRVLVDSDGDVEMLIPWLKEVGVEGILPLEYMAGVDVAKIRRDHPEFLMMGGYNKLIMKDGEAAMRAEFERLLPVMKSGGYIPSVDHQTPPDVSFENYQIYLKLLREYSVLA